MSHDSVWWHIGHPQWWAYDPQECCIRSRLWKMTWSHEIWNKFQTLEASMDFLGLPKGIKPIRYKWIFKKKSDMEGNIYAYETWLVAKGFTQKYNVNYDKSFSSIVILKIGVLEIDD